MIMVYILALIGACTVFCIVLLLTILLGQLIIERKGGMENGKKRM